MLLWMGGACIANAARCQRTHCRFTGPFLILMAALVAAYAAGILSLGPFGWDILAGAVFIGSAFLWWSSERIFGEFAVKNAGYSRRDGEPFLRWPMNGAQGRNRTDTPFGTGF